MVLQFDRETLIHRMQELEQEIADLDSKEPEDMESEAYEEWADQHEILEDELDDLRDALDR